MSSFASIRSYFEHPIRWIKRILSLQGGLIFLLVVLFSAFVAVMTSEAAEKIIGQLLGFGLSEENEKNKILMFLGIGMGGVLLALQAVIANTRAQAMVDAATAQAEANENTERGQRQERLKNAIEHLGHDSDSVRLGGCLRTLPTVAIGNPASFVFTDAEQSKDPGSSIKNVEDDRMEWSRRTKTSHPCPPIKNVGGFA